MIDQNDPFSAFRAARNRSGLSISDLAHKVGVIPLWIKRMECQFLVPRLKELVEMHWALEFTDQEQELIGQIYGCSVKGLFADNSQ